MKGFSGFKNSPIKKDKKYDPVKQAGTMTDEDPDTQGPVKPVSRTGPATGDRKFEGSGIITGMSVNQPLDGIVARSVTFQGTGALTIGTE